MRLYRNIWIGILLAVTLVFTGCSLLSKGEQAPEVPADPHEKVLKITAPRNTYAHIFRDFPEISEDAEEIILEARLYSPENVNDTSWLTSIILYWSDEPELHTKIGRVGTGAFRAMSPGVISTVSPKGEGDIGIPGNIWAHARIRLTSDRLEFWAKGEDDWILIKDRSLTTGTTPPLLAQSRPTQIMVGKGYVQSSSEGVFHLDDSAGKLSSSTVDSTYVADLVLWVDGEEVYREDFQTLDGWDVHIDPLNEELIDIEIVSTPKVGIVF